MRISKDGASKTLGDFGFVFQSVVYSHSLAEGVIYVL